LIKLAVFLASGAARMRLRVLEQQAAEQQNIQPQPATSPWVVSSGSNDSLRQAQGLSLSKAAESNIDRIPYFVIRRSSIVIHKGLL
jgi:hypothetical protein